MQAASLFYLADPELDRLYLFALQVNPSLHQAIALVALLRV